MRPPDFWDQDGGLARLLDPIGRGFGAITSRRALRTPATSPGVPVISVGNLTLGGTGKTPVAMDIAARLAARGRIPAIVLRGYGGRLKGPVAVDPARHTVDEVGDEALLHAALHPTWVARQRLAGAQAAVAAGADVIVLDDGHQHPGIAKDLALIVIDGRAGFGNGRIFPAGPLREAVPDGLARADAVIIMGEDEAGIAPILPPALPRFSARLAPRPAHGSLRGQNVVAFAGIGRPEKFFALLRELGAQVVARHAFGDHHDFAPADIQPILDEAFALRAIPITTAKDAVRLAPDQRQQVDVLTVDVAWDDASRFDALLDRALTRAKA